MTDSLEQWRLTLLKAKAEGSSVHIQGAGTKAFYGTKGVGEIIDTRAHSGIIHHEPTELVVTVKAGTPWHELETELQKHQQYLPFEPPFVNQGATVGGVVNAGWTGAARLSSGGIRDYVLGAHLLNAEGVLLKFGGQVMKNVAGYDISRLLVGSMGTLGLMTQVSLKLLPQPKATLSVCFTIGFTAAQKLCRLFLVKPIAVTGTAWFEGVLTVRLAGMNAAVEAGEVALLSWATESGVTDFQHLSPSAAQAFWDDVNEQRHPYFNHPPTPEHELWRVVLPTSVEGLSVMNDTGLALWGGSLRWRWQKNTQKEAQDLIQKCQQAGGHALRYRGHQAPFSENFLSARPELMALQEQVRRQFDPTSLFNRNRFGVTHVS